MNVRDPRWKRYSLFMVGVLMIIGACIVNIFLVSNFTWRTVSLSMTVTGVLAVNASRPSTFMGGRVSAGTLPAGRYVDQGPGPLAWILSALWLVALVVSYLILRDDVLHGGHVGWPVYAVAISGLGGGITWSYVVAKLIQRAGQ